METCGGCHDSTKVGGDVKRSTKASWKHQCLKHTHTHTHKKRLGSNQLKEGRQGKYELCKQKKKKTLREALKILVCLAWPSVLI